MKRLAQILLLCLMVALPEVVFATVTTIDNFETYTTGNLATQDSWTTVNNNMTVENTQVKTGTQAVSYTDSDLVGGQVKKSSIGALTNGTTTFYMRAGTTATIQKFTLLSGSSIVAAIQFRPAGAVTCDNSLGQNTISGATYVTNTWYQLDIHISSTNGNIQCRFNATNYSSVITQAFTSVDNVRITAGSDNTAATFWWDDFSFDDGAASTATFAPWQFSTFI